MKTLVAVFATLLFVGAGCTASTNTEIDVAPDVPTSCPDVCAAVCAGQPEPDVPRGCPMPMCACDQPAPSAADTDAGAAVDAEADAVIDVVGIQANTEADVTVDLTVSMDAGNFFFAPTTISAEAGQTVHVKINASSGTHTFVIDALGLKKMVRAGETITFTAPAAGSYEYYCDIGSHRAMGMKGTLIVN